jgi:hypothetical protein
MLEFCFVAVAGDSNRGVTIRKTVAGESRNSGGRHERVKRQIAIRSRLEIRKWLGFLLVRWDSNRGFAIRI